VGVPFVTEFELIVAKINAEDPLKCEFGYENEVGRVILPTSDTGDFLGISRGASSPTEFNRQNTVLRAKIPPYDAKNEEKNMRIFAQCWDSLGRTRYRNAVVKLDSRDLEIKGEDMEAALSTHVSKDINTLLLVTDRFTTTREGMPKYTNDIHLLKAMNILIEDIRHLEEDTIDFYKNKQLAHVLFMMTERLYHENVFKRPNNGKNVVRDLIEVSKKLILKMADEINVSSFDYGFTGSVFAQKVPLDLAGYTNLAQAVDNIVLMAREKMIEETVEQALDL
jgi:hypothetical protein